MKTTDSKPSALTPFATLVVPGALFAAAPYVYFQVHAELPVLSAVCAALTGVAMMTAGLLSVRSRLTGTKEVLPA